MSIGGSILTESEYARGYYITPTVFTDVTPDMRIAREEIFGPVLCVMRAKNFDHALNLANDTVYGLASSIYTRDLAKAQKFVEQSEVGLCHVNMPTSWKEPQFEFGGVKDSGRGMAEAGTLEPSFSPITKRFTCELLSSSPGSHSYMPHWRKVDVAGFSRLEIPAT